VLNRQGNKCLALHSVRDGINTYTFDELSLTCSMPSSLDIHPGRVVRPPGFNLEIRSILGWIGSGAAGESSRRVRLNRMGKLTPGINPLLTSNPKPNKDCVVWAK